MELMPMQHDTTAGNRSPFSYFYKNVLYEIEMSGRKEAITKEFLSLDSDARKFRFVWSLAPSWGPQYPFKRCNLLKSFSKSMAAKEEGNQFCADGKFDEALRSYNKAILLAPWDKEREDMNALGIAYASRSAVLFLTNQFSESLKDCNRALECKLMKSHRHMILHRMARIYAELKAPSLGLKSIQEALDCLQEAKEDETILERYKETEVILSRMMADGSGDTREEKDLVLTQRLEPKLPQCLMCDLGDYKLSEGQNHKFPAASCKIELAYTEQLGRHFKAVADLMPGEVLTLEKPFAHFLLPEHHQTHCHNCFVLCDLPIPCQNCCMVVFCSEECRSEIDLAHAVECPMMDPLYDGEIGSGALLALRTLFKKTPQEWITFSESSLGTREADKFREIVSPVYSPEDYENIFALVKNTQERNAPQLFHLATIAVYLLRVIQEFGSHYIPQDWPKTMTEKAIQVMGGIILRHLQNFPCNAHVLSEIGKPPEIERDSETWELKNAEICKDARVALGVAIYPTLSLVNHSCDPNCVRIDIGLQSALRVMYPIARGEQVTCSYGPHYSKCNRLLRREELKSRFFFKCSCHACTEEWPNFETLLERREKFKCPACCKPYVQNKSVDCDEGIPADDEFVCNKCKHDFTELVYVYRREQREYANHFAEVLGGKATRENGRFLERHIQTLHNLLIRPSGEFQDTYATLLQYYTRETDADN